MFLFEIRLKAGKMIKNVLLMKTGMTLRLSLTKTRFVPFVIHLNQSINVAKQHRRYFINPFVFSLIFIFWKLWWCARCARVYVYVCVFFVCWYVQLLTLRVKPSVVVNLARKELTDTHADPEVLKRSVFRLKNIIAEDVASAEEFISQVCSPSFSLGVVCVPTIPVLIRAILLLLQGGMEDVMSVIQRSKGTTEGYALAVLRSSLSYISGITFLTETHGLVYKLFDLVTSPSIQVQKQSLELVFFLSSYHDDGFRLVHRAAKHVAKVSKCAPGSDLCLVYWVVRIWVCCFALRFANNFFCLFVNL
jgi:hypothetical protein